MDNFMNSLGKIGIIPVIKIEEAKSAVPLVRALIEGGLSCIEITFRTAAAREAIEEISRSLPDFLVGAGTVLKIQQAQDAVKAGARFIVGPGYDPAIVDWCQVNQIPVIPGVATPSEVIMAMNRGLNVLKVFPAEVLGGVAFIQAIAPVFDGVKFVPTGGVTAKNLPDYLKLPSVLACGGSWLATHKMISEGQFDEITRLAHEAHNIVIQFRGEGG